MEDLKPIRVKLKGVKRRLNLPIKLARNSHRIPRRWSISKIKEGETIFVRLEFQKSDIETWEDAEVKVKQAIDVNCDGLVLAQYL